MQSSTSNSDKYLLSYSALTCRIVKQSDTDVKGFQFI